MTASLIVREHGTRRAPGRPRTGSGRLTARRQRPGLWFALPAAALLLVFFAYPLATSLLQSFFSTKGGESTFVGLDQYARLFRDPLVLKSLGTALLILVVQVPIMIALAVGLAYILNQAWVRFRSGFRLIAFLPAITTLVAYSVVFRVMMTTDGGALNQILGVFGAAPIDWLNNEWWARVAVIASITWRWTGYNMVIILAGLQAIPAELYEAARIDGASAWRRFRHVTLPMLGPTLTMVAVLTVSGYFQLFAEPYVMTGGGPLQSTTSVLYLIYRDGFAWWNLGTASAEAFALFALMFAVTAAMLWLARRGGRA